MMHACGICICPHQKGLNSQPKEQYLAVLQYLLSEAEMHSNNSELFVSMLHLVLSQHASFGAELKAGGPLQ